MRQPTIAAVIDKNKIATDRVWVFAMTLRVIDNTNTVVETLYLVNNNEQVTIDGNVYEPFPFTLDKSEKSGDITNISVVVADQTRYVQSRLQQYQGLVGSEVDLIVCTLDSGVTVGSSEPDLKETYTVIQASSSDYTSTLELGTLNLLNTLVPGRLQSKDRCSFRYKSTECGYSGGLTSCDFTLDGANGCVAHSNSDRFGGFPGLTNRAV